ncbi:MAG: DUF1624 domain-containing protein [Rhodobacteraceae bacterium]|jgi:uncharacterized membrane protein|nr:DUF1624 domain-containing protein [Paracoccaceae bacterium]
MTGERPRYLAIDLARTAALAGMVVFHFCYDLEIFGWLPQGTVVTGWFWWQARIVAGSFIFLAGLGLWLAQGKGVRPRAFLHRLARIAAAAALVTLATRLAMPGLTIFYGILHSIAVSSVLGLLFLRLPAPVTVLAAAAVAILPQIWSNPALGGWLVWIGLSGTVPITADFEPLFPWFAPFLLGIATGRGLSHFGLWPALDWPATPLLRRLAWPGQHSLAIYLIHQPVLFGAVFAFTWVWWRL